MNEENKNPNYNDNNVAPAQPENQTPSDRQATEAHASTVPVEQSATQTTPGEEANAIAEQATAEAAHDSNRKRNLIIGSVILVVIVLLGLWYAMERNGQLDTGLFDAVEQARLQQEVVATINGEEISAYDLSVSQEQISAAAQAQGVDLNDPATQQSIRDQAVDMLVNTELLRQEAESRGLSVSEEEVENRYEALVSEVGGEEILQARMNDFGVTEDVLFRDIHNELLIQKLLDEVFAETEVIVSAEEIQNFYDSAGGTEGGLPPLEEVSSQIEQQLAGTKEQEVVTEFVDNLRSEAEIDIKLEL